MEGYGFVGYKQRSAWVPYKDVGRFAYGEIRLHLIKCLTSAPIGWRNYGRHGIDTAATLDIDG